MRLRLSPQSRIDPKTLGRQHIYNGPRPWADKEDKHVKDDKDET
jgi:hypothetical protein